MRLECFGKNSEDSRMFAPDLLTCADGTPVERAEQWESRRAELIAILEREQYGIQPPYDGAATGRILERDEACCAGHAVLEKLSVSFNTPAGPFSFPVQFVYPTDGQTHPLFLLMNFRPDIYDRYCPVEEIIDHGFALAMFCYSHITSDDGDMTSGLAGCYERRDPATDWGKLSMWAFAASRALDYLLTRREVDGDNAAVIGHSRLGKAALLCAAKDRRIRFAFSNDSGCGGAALEQTKHAGAETYADMDRLFPYWFCGNRKAYISDRAKLPYDQHFLLAAIAPRYVSVGSAGFDRWADQYSEQLCCVAASPAWVLHGKPGFIGPEAPAAVDTAYLEGHIGYHLRHGDHFLSRRDWLYYMDFAKKHLK